MGTHARDIDADQRGDAALVSPTHRLRSSHDCNIPVLSWPGGETNASHTSSGDRDAQAKPLVGLVCAFMSVRLHRQLVILRSLIYRFEHDIERSSMSGVRLPTEKLVQRLDWLDTAIIELRDRSRLLQAESMLKGAEQANRNPHLLAIMTTVFLPATLVAGIFGFNVGGCR